MIIGISGKIGSGKDTVGRIIQYLTLEPPNSSIFGVNSELTFDKYKKAISAYHPMNIWEVKKFAYKLKQICSLLTGIPVEDFEKQEVKDSLLGEEWTKVHCADCKIEKKYQNPHNREIGYYECPQCKVSGLSNHQWFKPTVRWLLQTVGTEAMREGVHTNVWINALFADYKLGPQSVIMSERELPNWIITDMRFPNELKAIKDRGGITIRVNTLFIDHEKKITRVDFENEHESETALDTAKFDHIINNNGTIEDLVQQVKHILMKEQII